MTVLADGRRVRAPRLTASETAALVSGEVVSKAVLTMGVGDWFAIGRAPVMCRWRRGPMCSLRRMSVEELRYSRGEVQ